MPFRGSSSGKAPALRKRAVSAPEVDEETRCKGVVVNLGFELTAEGVCLLMERIVWVRSQH